MIASRTALGLACAIALCQCGKKEPESSNATSDKPANAPMKSLQQPPVLPPSAGLANGTKPDEVLELRRAATSRLAPIVGNWTSALTPEQWAAIRREYWPTSFNQQSNIIAGGRIDQSLPSAKLKTPLCIQLAKGDLAEFGDKKEQEALTALYLIATRDAMQGGRSLPNAFADRLSDPSTSYGDLLLFEIFDDTLVEAVKSRPLGADEVTSWRSMATAANPACRLLALKSFRRVALDQSQWLQFYAEYRNERRPDIIEALVQQLFESAHPDAVAMLGELENNFAVKASPELATRVTQTKADLISVITPASAKQ